jgi:hypothetical protein
MIRKARLSDEAPSRPAGAEGSKLNKAMRMEDEDDADIGECFWLGVRVGRVLVLS